MSINNINPMSLEELKANFFKLQVSVRTGQTLEEVITSTLELLRQFCEGRDSVAIDVLEQLHLTLPSSKKFMKKYVRTKRADIFAKYQALAEPHISIVNLYGKKHPDILYVPYDTSFNHILWVAFGSSKNPLTPPTNELPEDDHYRIYYNFVESIYNEKVLHQILETGAIFSFIKNNTLTSLSQEMPELFKQFNEDSAKFLRDIGFTRACAEASRLSIEEFSEIQKLTPLELTQWTHIRVGDRWIKITYDCE